MTIKDFFIRNSMLLISAVAAIEHHYIATSDLVKADALDQALQWTIFGIGVSSAAILWPVQKMACDAKEKRKWDDLINSIGENLYDPPPWSRPPRLH